MRTGRLTFPPPPLDRRRLATPTELPAITDHPKAAFLCGWWSGIVVGIVIGFALAVVLAPGAR